MANVEPPGPACGGEPPGVASARILCAAAAEAERKARNYAPGAGPASATSLSNTGTTTTVATTADATDNANANANACPASLASLSAVTSAAWDLYNAEADFFLGRASGSSVVAALEIARDIARARVERMTLAAQGKVENGAEIEALCVRENLLFQERAERARVVSHPRPGQRAAEDHQASVSGGDREGNEDGLARWRGIAADAPVIDPRKASGVGLEGNAAAGLRVRRYLALKLASRGHFFNVDDDAGGLLEIAGDLFANHREKCRLLCDQLPPVDRRIQAFLDLYLADKCPPGGVPRLPGETLVLDRYGLARELSLPKDSDVFKCDLIESVRVDNGVCHNPASDRRTTTGVFHIADAGFPVPADKKAVPLEAFAGLLAKALAPSESMCELPYTADAESKLKVRAMCSLMMRPLVVPAIHGRCSEKRFEIRYFAPGNMVSNLDFVESIFGNAGDPLLPENDAALDPDTWTGTTGCVILAPQMLEMRKKELGLPHYDDATDRQRREGMCWKDEGELYNDGCAFKICLRGPEGVMVTLIADNYFGYCKKETKTQIGFAANIYGLAEEEHAGGAIAFPSYCLGDEFHLDSRVPNKGHRLEHLPQYLGERIRLQPEGYGIDAVDDSIIYVPHTVRISVPLQSVAWNNAGTEHALKLLPGKTYILPSGYKVRMERHPAAPIFRLVGTMPTGTFCHKPSTVSGGGKSEISKSMTDAVIYGSFFINDIGKDLAAVDALIRKDYAHRFRPEHRPTTPSRPVLSEQRSLGSVIKLFTPNEMWTDEYNAWVEGIPSHIKAVLFLVKRLYNSSWGDNWMEPFSADMINGQTGHEFKFRDRKVMGSYLRVGRGDHGEWRTYKLRQDFIAADKVQMEDDITASVIVPRTWLHEGTVPSAETSVKISQNCEFRLFQRPDDAIHRGFDKQTEIDISGPANLIANFEPLSRAQLRELRDGVVDFDRFSQPMKSFLEAAASKRDGYAVSSAHPRIVDGKPTKNPRYLQLRPDFSNPRGKYIAEIGHRLQQRIDARFPVVWPVDAVLPGRRNNPADKKLGVPALAVYNPLHFQELPELFMDFICSVTGKSPSTTGFGSEGALTKGPFNAMPATADLNSALIGMVLTGHSGFTSAAGVIGPQVVVEHDFSLLVPEIWCRLSDEERDPRYLIEKGMLEKVEDFEHEGKAVLGSRLGYRINRAWVNGLLGRIFDDPHSVFTDRMLKPEKQDMATFVDGINNIVSSQRRVAQAYLDDGTIAGAIPPLKAILHIMATGTFEGKGVSDPEIRALFTRDSILGSEWYRKRLLTKQKRDVARAQNAVAYIRGFMKKSTHGEIASQLNLPRRLAVAEAELKTVSDPSYLEQLRGTVGADPLEF